MKLGPALLALPREAQLMMPIANQDLKACTISVTWEQVLGLQCRPES